MDLRNWELYAGTALPVVGASVSVYEADLAHPNPNSALTTTTTDASGMWQFSGLSDTPKDVKIEYGGRTKWYKGLTLHSVAAVRESAEDPHVEQNLLRNGGFEVNTTGASSFSPGTTTAAIFDGWQARRGTGDTLTLSLDSAVRPANSTQALKAVYTKSSGDAYVEAALPTLQAVALRGQTLSFSVQAYQGAAGAVRAFITDGVTTSYAATSATTGSWITSSVQNVTVDAAAAGVTFGVRIEQSGTHYLDNAMAVYGTEAESYVPRFDDADEYTIVETAPAADTGRLATLLNNLAERVRALAGTADWKDAIAVALTGKVSKVGDVMTGALALANNIALQCKDTGGAARDLVKITAANVPELGNVNFGTVRLLGFAADSLVYQFFNGTGAGSDWKIWHGGNDGAGSFLDADMVDGQHASAFATSGHNHDGSYATAGHNHAGVYQPVGSYAASSHSHTTSATGSYTGNGSSQAITVGFQPKLVFIQETAGARHGLIVFSSGAALSIVPGSTPVFYNSVTYTASGFFLGASFFNSSGFGYAYTAVA